MNRKTSNNEPIPSSGRYSRSDLPSFNQDEYCSKMLQRLTELEEITKNEDQILSESKEITFKIAKITLSEKLSEYKDRHSEIISSAESDLNNIAKKSTAQLTLAYNKEMSSIAETLSSLEASSRQRWRKILHIDDSTTLTITKYSAIFGEISIVFSLVHQYLDGEMRASYSYAFIAAFGILVYLIICHYMDNKKGCRYQMRQYNNPVNDLNKIRSKSRRDYFLDMEISINEIINLHFSNIVSKDEIILVEMQSTQLVESQENYIIRSESIEDVCQFIEQHETSSLGISGSRGIGKSTILRQLAVKFNGPENCVVNISVPVRYKPEAMIQRLLHDFITQAKNWKESYHRPDIAKSSESSFSRSTSIIAPLMTMSAIVGFTFFYVREFFIYSNGGSLSLLFHRLAILTAIVCASMVIILLFLRVLYKKGFRSIPFLGRSASDLSLYKRITDENEIYSLENVEERLRWHTERSNSNEYSATIPKLPFGIRRSSQTRLSDNVKGIHDFTIEFQRAVSYFRESESIEKIIFCIDELDKIGATQGGLEIVNELKDLMHMKGVHFVLTVSDDALKSFTLRGIPVRDAIDSTFDEVFEIKELSVKEANDIIVKRERSFPLPLTRFCYVWSLGNPRELLRCARKCVKAAKYCRSENAGAQSQNTSSTNARIGLGAIASQVVLKDLDAVIMMSIETLHKCGLDRCIITEFRSAYSKLDFSEMANLLKSNMNSVEDGFYSEIIALTEYVVFAERVLSEFTASRPYSEWLKEMNEGKLDDIAETISQKRISDRRWLGINA